MDGKIMNKINKIVFFNNCNNGDLHYSREFLKYLKKSLPNKELYVSHFKCPDILKDVGITYNLIDTRSILQTPFHTNKDVLFVNTWIGVENGKWISQGSCTLKNNYKLFENIASNLGVTLLSEENYIPSIDYDKFNIRNLNFNGNNIFISNGPVLSGQSKNFDFAPIINKLAEKYFYCNFFVTQPFETNFSNVIDANKFFYANGKSNLNQLSYLSTFCSIIVGRASGPYCFIHTKQNMYDKNKIYIVCGEREGECHWATLSDYNIQGCKQIWCKSDDNCEQNVSNIMEECINEKFGNR